MLEFYNQNFLLAVLVYSLHLHSYDHIIIGATHTSLPVKFLNAATTMTVESSILYLRLQSVTTVTIMWRDEKAFALLQP